MGKSCTVLAHVRRPSGEIVESKLFKDLLHYTSNNREISKEYYAVGTSEKFLSQVRDRKEYKEDENGEITFKSLKDLAKIDLETDKLIDTLNKDIHSGKYSYEDAIKKVQYFNENNVFADRALATMTGVGSGQYFVSVVPLTKNTTNEKGKEGKEAVNTDERQKLHQTVRNKELQKRLVDLLNRHKVSVKFLEGEREGGRYSTENVSKAEDGLYALIDIVMGEHTTENLAEEAGHFAIGALGDYPLVKRLESLLEDEKTQKEAIGQDRYDKELLGNNPAREVAGKLVGKALQRSLGTGKTIFVLANRIANLAKRVFYNIRGNEVRWAAAKAEQIANKIAYQFVEGDSKFSVDNAINILEVMHNAHKSTNVETYKEIVNELGSLCKKLESIANDKLLNQMKSSTAQTIIAGADTAGKSAVEYANERIDAMADSLAFDGIVQGLTQIVDYLAPGAQLSNLMAEVDVNNPSKFFANLAKNARYLRQARAILDSADCILDLANTKFNQYYAKEGIKVTNGTSASDVNYKDIQGEWHNINLKRMIKDFRTIVSERKTDLGCLEQAYFIKFCENIYGSKYINTTTSLLWKEIWSGDFSTDRKTEIAIDDLVMGIGQHDIDMYHRFLSSMSNNPDIIGQIVDKATKMANKVADDLAGRYQERLDIMKSRAKRLGIKIEDLAERDENGNLTGNFIMPPAAPTQNGNMEEDFICKAYMDDLNTDDVDDVYAVSYSEWENARDEFKKQEWENFKKNNPNWKGMSNLKRGLEWGQYFSVKMKEWNKSNSIKVKVKLADGKEYTKWVPNRIYKSDAWNNLKAKYPETVNNDNLSRWMHDYLEIKRELDSYLPAGATRLYRMPQFRGTFNNTVRNKIESGGSRAGSWLKTFGRRGILECFVETADDTDYGDDTTMNHPDEELLGTKLDYELEKANRLPIFGVNKLKNMQDLATDIFGSTLAYASMATTYGSMSNLVDALEVGKEALYERKFTEEGSWLRRQDHKMGVFADRRYRKNHQLKDNGEASLAYTRYLKFLDKQMYGISSARYGFTFKGGTRILLNKILSNLSSLAGIAFIKGNVLGGAVNTATGFNNVFKEAITGEYFNTKDWTAANKYYWSSFGTMWIRDFGSKTKHSRLDLFLYRMNALSDNKERFKSWHTNRSRLNNFFRMSGYLPYSAGDHYMQAMSYLAIAHGTDLFDEDGVRLSNLWDAFTKVDNTDAMDEFKHGKTLEFGKFCPLNESDITISALNQGVYLKKINKSEVNFRRWLYTQDAQFKDAGYLSQNIDEYEDYKRKFAAMSDQDLVNFQSEQYKICRSILQKIEDCLAAMKSPILGGNAAPQFTPAELQYLDIKDLGTGDYKNIMQTVQADIYNIVWSKADESKYMDRCREINDRLHGIYNQQDKTAFHNNLFGNMFLAMKGWALGYLENMWSGSHHSIALEKDVEGFMNTALKVPASVICSKITGAPSMSIMDLAITMTVPWTKRSRKAMKKAGFTESLYYNARRMVSSLIVMGMIGALFTLLKMRHDDAVDYGEEDELTVYEGLLYYLAYRTLLEQEVFMGPMTTLIESGSLLDLMPTGVAALADVTTLLWQGIGAIFADEGNKNFYYQSDEANDKYEEGDTKFGVHFQRLVPYVKSWWALQHPYEAVDSYEFGRKMRTR